MYRAERVFVGRGLRLDDIVKMVQTATSKKTAPSCVDVRDQCTAGYRVKLFQSLTSNSNKVLWHSDVRDRKTVHLG